VSAQLFRKKPVVIEAMQFTDEEGGLASEIVAWIERMLADDTTLTGPVAYWTGNTIAICTLEGVMHAGISDWIIRGVKGEFYPCKPDIFDATYEAIA
jgi:hypothetical protein